MPIPQEFRERCRLSRKTGRTGHALNNMRVRHLIPEGADLEAIAAIYAEAQELSEAFGFEYHVDHIVPLSKGGKHHQDNLQILLAEDNLAKKAREDWVMPPPSPSDFRRYTKHFACGLTAHYEHGEFKGLTFNEGSNQ